MAGTTATTPCDNGTVVDNMSLVATRCTYGLETGHGNISAASVADRSRGLV